MSTHAFLIAIGVLVFALTAGYVFIAYIGYWWTTQRPGRGYPKYVPPRERHEVIGGGNGRVSADERWAA